MKRIFCITMMVMLAIGGRVSAYAGEDITVILNNRTLTFENKPYIDDGTTMVPMRGIFEALGASVDYNADTKTIYAKVNGTNIELVTGSYSAKVNDKYISLSKAVENKNGSTMVPLRFVSEASGAKVNWDGENKIVTIDSTGGNNIGTSVEDKVLEIREKFKNTNAETDYSIRYFAGMDLSGNVYTDNKTGKVRKVIVDELYTRDDDYLVEMYVDNGKVYFVYEIYTNTQTNEKKEYRFYIDNNKLIRYIGPDGVVQDGLDTEEYRQAENSVFNNMIRYYWKYAFNEEY